MTRLLKLGYSHHSSWWNIDNKSINTDKTKKKIISFLIKQWSYKVFFSISPKYPFFSWKFSLRFVKISVYYGKGNWENKLEFSRLFSLRATSQRQVKKCAMIKSTDGDKTISRTWQPFFGRSQQPHITENNA